MPPSVVDAYRILGIENGASLDVVKSTYKQVALRTHPDKNPDNPDATAEFQKVSEAYNVLLKHLDTSTPRASRFPGFPHFDPGSDDEDEYEYDDYYEDESDEYDENLDFYMFLFEELMGGRANRFANSRFRRGPIFQRPPVDQESPEQYQARLRRTREDQAAAQERRKQEAIARKAREEKDRERERLAAEERQRVRVEGKKAQAEAQRNKAETAARKLKQRVQTGRSAVFAAARSGKAAEVKKGIWEDEVDAAGGEVKSGCDEFVKSPPKDPQETLLHIACRKGDTDLVEWLDAHNADPEERDSQKFTPFHVALQSGHIPIVTYFFEAHSPKDEDSNGIYEPPESKTLLSIALESREPQLVWMILDKELATEQDINLSWTSAMKSRTKGSDEKFEDIMELLMRFGGFTPPPTPSSSDNSDEDEQWDAKQSSGHTRPNFEQQSSSNTSPAAGQQKQANAGRGGKRGRGRGPWKGWCRASRERVNRNADTSTNS
ncbi:DnaJ domain-containing protein [Mycena rebaudengoi]|nr:DnaJ domain-containing protein [Mycena rebaudengoi]